MYIKQIIQVYRNSRFIVYTFLFHQKCKRHREALLLITPPVKLNVMSKLEDVLEIKRSN